MRWALHAFVAANLWLRKWWHDMGRCSHTSHRLALRCWRSWEWQYRCGYHNSIDACRRRECEK